MGLLARGPDQGCLKRCGEGPALSHLGPGAQQAVPAFELHVPDSVVSVGLVPIPEDECP